VAKNNQRKGTKIISGNYQYRKIFSLTENYKKYYNKNSSKKQKIFKRPLFI